MNTENRVYLFFFLLTALILLPLSSVTETEAQSSFLLLPDSLTSLGSNSFTGVISAADIYIPSGVTDIGDDVLDISRIRVHCFYGSYAWNYFAAKYPGYTSGLIPWNGIKPTGRTISSNSKAAAAKTKAVTALLNRFQNSDGMELLLSYDTNNLPLSNTAFTYDNALAAMAFLSDGKAEAAARILDSFVYAVNHDRLGTNDRIRNAYLAGPVDTQTDIIPAGWWNESVQRWEEDAYQVGCNTGNTAYAALALL